MTSPTAEIESKENRDIMILDVPNTFLQTPIPKGEEKIILKVTGMLVDVLVEICPGVYLNM